VGFTDGAEEHVDLDAASDCISPFTDVESRDGSSGYFSDDYQLITDVRSDLRFFK